MAYKPTINFCWCLRKIKGNQGAGGGGGEKQTNETARWIEEQQKRKRDADSPVTNSN
jgi:hypothetical protein